MEQLTVRDAVAADVPGIVAMYADDEFGGAREHPGDPLPEPYWAAFRAIAADPRTRLLVAEQDGEVVATLQLSYLPHLVGGGAERAQVEGVRVRSDRRGRGLGHRLLQWAVQAARERGCGLVQLTSNRRRTDALRFYESLGFAASHCGMKLDLDRSEPGPR